jgi:hypothetical protein
LIPVEPVDQAVEHVAGVTQGIHSGVAIMHGDSDLIADGPDAFTPCSVCWLGGRGADVITLVAGATQRASVLVGYVVGGVAVRASSAVSRNGDVAHSLHAHLALAQCGCLLVLGGGVVGGRLVLSAN